MPNGSRLRIPGAVRRALRTASVGPHPAPEALAALAERALGAEDRQQVLTHVSACSECREALDLALAFPEESPATAGAVPESRRARHGFFLSWGALRWGAAAAAVAIVVVAVSLRLERKNATPSQTQNALGQLKTSPAPAAPPNPSTAVVAAKIAVPSAPATGEKKEAAPNTHLAGLQKEAATGAKANVSSTSAPQSATATMAEPAMTAKTADEPAIAHTAVPATPPEISSALARQNGVSGGPLFKASGGAAGVGATEAANQATAAARAQAPPPIGAEAKPAAAPQPAALSSNADAMALRQAASFDNVSRQWRIRSGEIEKFEASGAWEEIAVAKGGGFAAVFALGNDVWAGASRGRIFHSGDNGAHWSLTILPLSETQRGSATVTSIRFGGHDNGTVIVSFSPPDLRTVQRWQTSDGGEHWSLVSGR